ncbi:MAG: hypothetical protein HOV87_30475 [Catenulispora sp.]|nr:hypothetical protein [Catenulispora sp.]
MKRALTLATGFAAGYVVGTRAGREKYEQLKDKVHEVSHQPAVVDMRENLQEQVGTATKAVVEKVTDVASGLSKKLHSSSDGETESSRHSTTEPATGEYPSAPTGLPGSV